MIHSPWRKSKSRAPLGHAARTSSGMSKKGIEHDHTDKSALEPSRLLGRHAELALQCQPGPPQRAVLEQAADEGNPVWHAARRVEFRQRFPGIWRPVASRF